MNRGRPPMTAPADAPVPTGPAGPCSARPARAAEVRLSAVELDACWELLALGDTPLTLCLPSPGRTWAERHRILTSVLVTLRRKGLAERSTPNELLATPLRVLARPDYQLDVRLGGGPRGHLVGIGAVAGQRGVLVVQVGEQLRLRSVPPSSVLSGVVGIVGSMPAGVGRPVNIAAEVFDAAHRATTDRKLWTMADHLISRGVPRTDAASWVRMCTGIQAIGQLGTAFRTDGGTRFGPWVIGFHTTAGGHFLQLRRPGPAGDTVTVCPLDAPRLTRLAAELLAAGPAR